MEPEKQLDSYMYNVCSFSGSIKDIQIGSYIFWSINIPFDFIYEIQVVYRVDDSEGSFILNKSNPISILVPRRQENRDIKLEYDLEFRTQDGTYRENSLLADTCNFIYNPFTFRSVQFFPIDMLSKDSYIKRIQLSYYYNEQGTDWRMMGKVKQATLSTESTISSMQYPVVDSKRAVIVYEGTILGDKGKFEVIPKSTSNQCIVPIGTEMGWISIEVDSSRVNWTKYKKVEVYLYSGNTDIGAEQIWETLTFNSSTMSLYWGFLDNIKSRQPYYWKASYYTQDYLEPINTGIHQEPFYTYIVLPVQLNNQ